MKKVRSSQAAILVLNGYRTISLGQLPPGQLPPRRLPPGKLLWIEWNRVFPIVKLRKLKFWVRHFSSIVTSSEYLKYLYSISHLFLSRTNLFLFNNLFISLIELINIHENHLLKEHRCKFKRDKITYLKRSVKERITLPKISLQCILKLYNAFGVTKPTLLLLCFIPILVYNPFIILIVNHYLIFLCFP